MGRDGPSWVHFVVAVELAELVPDERVDLMVEGLQLAVQSLHFIAKVFIFVRPEPEIACVLDTRNI